MKCPPCNGKGYHFNIINGDRATYTRRDTCNYCKGTGEVSVRKGENQCKNCGGSGNLAGWGYSELGKCSICNGYGYM